MTEKTTATPIGNLADLPRHAPPGTDHEVSSLGPGPLERVLVCSSPVPA